jgi:hypothetical protein
LRIACYAASSGIGVGVRVLRGVSFGQVGTGGPVIQCSRECLGSPAYFTN